MSIRGSAIFGGILLAFISSLFGVVLGATMIAIALFVQGQIVSTAIATVVFVVSIIVFLRLLRWFLDAA